MIINKWPPNCLIVHLNSLFPDTIMTQIPKRSNSIHHSYLTSFKLFYIVSYSVFRSSYITMQFGRISTSNITSSIFRVRISWGRIRAFYSSTARWCMQNFDCRYNEKGMVYLEGRKSPHSNKQMVLPLSDLVMTNGVPWLSEAEESSMWGSLIAHHLDVIVGILVYIFAYCYHCEK